MLIEENVEVCVIYLKIITVLIHGSKSDNEKINNAQYISIFSSVTNYKQLLANSSEMVLELAFRLLRNGKTFNWGLECHF